MVSMENNQAIVPHDFPKDYSLLDSKAMAISFLIPAGFTGQGALWFAATAPAGWLFCDGSVVNISDYPRLFAVLGITYGGNGTSTFGLPDLRGRVPIGVGTGTGLTARTLATQYGAETHTHALSDSAYAQLYLHNAGGNSFVDGRAISSGVTAFTSTDRVSSAGTTSGVNSTSGIPLRGATDSGSSLPPLVGVNFIIKT